MGSPSFLAIHPNRKFLYAVGEGGGKDGGPVVAFALDPKTGALTKLNEDRSGGGGPCHIVVSPKGDYAAVANYGGGSTALFKLGADGKIVDRVGFVQHKGSGAEQGPTEGTARRTAAVHRPEGRTRRYRRPRHRQGEVSRFDATKGLVEDARGRHRNAARQRPAAHRHRPGRQVRLCVRRTRFDRERDRTICGKVVQSLSTLPAPTKGNSTAECIISPDGKFVYVSNRGHNSIAVFKVNEDRKLTAAGHITGDIKIPRNFNIDPSGKWMLIASQDGGKVGVWELDAKTGGGKETGTTVKVSRCVCVKFVPVEK